jgi:hypothetical protein
LSEAPSLSFESAHEEDLDELLANEPKSESPPPEKVSPFAHIDLTLVRFSPELLETIPQEIAEQYEVLPVYLRKAQKRKKTRTPGLLYIAAANPEDQVILEDCALCCNLTVRAFQADPQEIREAIPIVYRGGTLARPEAPSSQIAAPPPPPVSTTTKVEAPPPPRPTSTSMPELPLIRPSTAATPAPLPASELPTDPPPPPAPSAEPSASATPASRAAPLLVVLGGGIGLEHYCHEAIAPLGGHVESWEIGRTSEMKPEPRPDLLLVSEELYLFDRRAFNLLAFRVGVPLVVWSQEMDPADLQAVLLAARCGSDRKDKLRSCRTFPRRNRIFWSDPRKLSLPWG